MSDLGDYEEPAKKEREHDFFLWTIQLAKWRDLKDTDIKLLDITVQSGIKAFAPDWDFLQAYKKGEIGEDEYTREYLDKMEWTKGNSYLPFNYSNGRPAVKTWDHLSMYPKVAYACFCPAGCFCHRHIFVNLAADHLRSMGWNPKIMGEFMPTPKETADHADARCTSVSG